MHYSGKISASDFQGVLEEVSRSVTPAIGKGRPASYIPQLRRVDPRKFGIAIATLDGSDCGAGDYDEPFSIQSISKLIALMIALGRYGDAIWERIGKEPSGDSFNSLVLLEHERGVPRNPFINAGALVVTDMLMSAYPDVPHWMQHYLHRLAGDEAFGIDARVAASEQRTAHANRAIAHMLKSYRRIRHDPDDVVASYVGQCAIAMSCRQLARALLPLADNGYSPIAKDSFLTARLARRVNALLFTSGMYDSAGSFAYRVGLPAKSGVGGGIAAVIPHVGVVVTWSPGLDRFGNSLVGATALEQFTLLTNLSIL